MFSKIHALPQNKKITLPDLLLLVLVATSFLAAFLTYTHYGWTWDEPLFYQYGDALGYAYTPSNWFRPDFDLENAYGPSGTDHKIYGSAYLLIGQLVRSTLRFVLPEQDWTLWRLVNFMTFQLGVWGLYGLSRRWLSPPAALFSAALFASQPLLWGMAFINPKDIPFMVLFILTVWSGFRWVDGWLGVSQRSMSSRVLPAPHQPSALVNKLRRPAWVGLAVILWFGIWLSNSAWDGIARWLIQALFRAEEGTWLFGLFHSLAENANTLPEAAYIAKATALLNRFRLGYILAASPLLLVCLGILGYTRIVTFLAGLWHGLQPLPKLPAWRWLPLAVSGTVEPRRMAARTVLAAVLLGLLTSVRVLGPLAGLLVLAYFLLRSEPRSWLPWLGYAAIACIISCITWPYLWEAPLTRFLDVFQHMSDNPQIIPVLFNGVVLPSVDLPRSYLPVMMGLTLTEPVWFLAGSGLLGVLWRLSRADLEWRSLVVILAWFAIPVVYVLWRRPPMYDGFRHFFFILPPVFILAGFGIDFLWRRFKPGLVATAALLLLLPGLLGILQTHPFEYTYYNQFTGGPAGAFRRFETDYWLTCYKEMMAQFNEMALQNKVTSTLYVRRQPANAVLYAIPGIDIQRYNPAEDSTVSGDFILLPTRANTDQIIHPEAPVIMEVNQAGAVFCVIRQIP